MTTYNIADLKTPADFTARLTFGHIEEFRASLERALNRPDLEVYADDDGGALSLAETNTDGPDQLVAGNDYINIHVRPVGLSIDDSTDRGVWDILVALPHEDNDASEWTNSYLMLVHDVDMESLEEVSVENGNPNMMQTFVDRINYWL